MVGRVSTSLFVKPILHLTGMDALILPADAGVSNVRAKRGVIAFVAQLGLLSAISVTVLVTY